MEISIKNNAPEFYKETCLTFIFEDEPVIPEYLNDDDRKYAEKQIALEKKNFPLFNGSQTSYLTLVKPDSDLESFRKSGNEFFTILNTNKEITLAIDGSSIEPAQLLAFVEGIRLSSYQFIKYFKTEEQDKKRYNLDKLELYHPDIKQEAVEDLKNQFRAVFWARDMVNEPVISLNAPKFAEKIVQLGNEAGFSVEVLDKKQIQSLKMGGLLAVNKGSIDPPTFTIAEWKPANAGNQKPYVLVGKGVMYDTGGLSLKPTANSMDEMKCDMAGAAAVAGSIYYLALSKLPVWVVGLIPATDNRPDGNSYAPGDVIQMLNGLHVEVMNTDAEGRLILADALSYGDKYNPELVIDMATLTGSAQMAIGKHASVFMGNAGQSYFENLKKAGENTHERLVQFPFWDDYKEALKSNIADLKNLGEREAGSISAGKFLEHFTQTPYIHIDIAGTAFLSADDSYRLKGGTGVGVRLLAEFFKIVSKPWQKN